MVVGFDSFFVNDVSWGIQVIGPTDERWWSGAGDDPKGFSTCSNLVGG